MKITNVFAIKTIGINIAGLFLFRCSPKNPSPNFAIPKKIVDLGALVTEDLTERVWGKGYLTARGYTRPNSFDAIKWDRNGILAGSNSYYTLFNHGGPHVDAPKHISHSPPVIMLYFIVVEFEIRRD